MMEFGFYPLSGLALGGFLYAVYYFLLRLRCNPHWSQMFIVASVVLATLYTFVAPVRSVQASASEAPAAQPVVLQSIEQAFAKAHRERPLLSEKAEREAIMSEAAESGSLVAMAYQNVHWLYLFGVAILIAVYFLQLAYLWMLCRLHHRVDETVERVRVFELPSGQPPFSFGRCVFMPAGLESQIRGYVLKHELCHIHCHHFLWLCLMNLLVAFNWFNPFVWMFLYELRMQQELEADSDVLSEGIPAKDYQVSLVAMATYRPVWNLSRLAFFSQPLKKRLLFMNTSIDRHQMRIRLQAAAVLAASVLILVTVFSCKTKELAWKHPLQGCWQLESYRTADDPDTYEKHFHAQQYKYFGNGGELVITFSERDGLNFPSFQMCGMEQRLNGKALTDRHGVPIQYEMDGTDIHIWHWMKHINENKDSVEQIERWRRIKADPHLDRLFREISATCKLKQTDGTAGMWKLDSIKVWKSDSGKTKMYPITPTTFLIISDSQLYMRFWNEESHNNRFLDFVIHGDCGELKMPNSHQITFPEFTYDICPETNSGSLVLSDQQTNSARWYYERVPNPEFVIQMLRPALAE